MRINDITRESINHDLFEKLCRARCSYEEMCSFLNVSLPCLRKWVYLFYHEDLAVLKSRFVEAGNADIRIAKYEAAKNGNWQAIQWEAKQRLGDRDPDKNIMPVEESQDIEDLSPISEMLFKGSKK